MKWWKTCNVEGCDRTAAFLRHETLGPICYYHAANMPRKETVGWWPTYLADTDNGS